MKNNSSYKSFLTGAMVGALGLGVVGMTMMSKEKHPFKKARLNAANMTTRISHEAGNMISSAGDALANKMR